MRLFVGIHLPESTQQATAGAADILRARTARAAPRTTIRWVNRDNLHITLWFLGELDETLADTVLTALDAPFRVAPFTTSFRGAGFFPPSGRPGVLWLGVEKGRESLLTVHDQVRARLVPKGFPAEARAYSPHLTIGRVKDVRRSEMAALRAAVAETTVDIGPFDVKEVTLFRSRTSAGGARYESLLRVPLEAWAA
jgi:2'-5' RNA ligase